MLRRCVGWQDVRPTNQARDRSVPQPLQMKGIIRTDFDCGNKPRRRVHCGIVDGVPKWQRRGSVAAVQFGGAPLSVSGSREDGGFSLYLLQLHREVQECDPTWSFGKRFVGWC